MRHALLAATILAASGMGLAASGAGFAAFAQEAPTQTLKIALREDADALDPTLARSYVGRIVFASLCDKLFDINQKLEIVPQLALSYDWPDPKTLVIKLRPGVKFQDGTDMDAAAVKYSLERHLNMQGSSRRGEISTMDHVDVVDPLTVKIALKSPTSPFVAQLTDRAGMIVSPKAAEAAGKDFALHPVCAGPFKFTERVAQDRIVLDRFPDYWDAKNIHFAKVIFQPIVDSTTRLANLQAGAVDLVESVVPSDVAAVKGNARLKLVTSNGLGYQSINFNVAHGPRASGPISTNPLVRQAFDLAIDRSALNDVVFNGMFPPISQAVPSDSPFYDRALPPHARDVAKAKALLAQAGVKLPVTFTLTVPNSPVVIQAAEVMQSMASEAGFDMKLSTMEFASSLDAADRGDFEAYMIAWSGRTDPDGNLWNFMHTGGPLNYPAYSDKEMDSWLDQARAVTDLPTRAALYAKVSEKSAKDLPIMYLYAPVNIVGMSAKLSGFVPVGDGLIRVQGMSMAK
jgi:peptide/nickel transport system substrate-binding protein